MKKNVFMNLMGVSGNTNAYINKVLSIEPDSLISYLPMNEKRGTTFVDRSSKGNNAAITGTITLANSTGIGDGNKAPLFGGGIANLYSADFNTDFLANKLEKTFMIWVKATLAWSGTGNKYMQYFRADNNNRTFIQNANTGAKSYTVFSGGVASDLGFPDFSDWRCLVCVWNVTEDYTKLYLNGIQVGATQTGLLEWAGNLVSTQAVIGASNTSGTDPWKGYLAHFALWNKALTEAQIISISSPQSEALLQNVSQSVLFTGEAPDDWLGRPVLLDNNGTWVIVYKQAPDHAASAEGRLHIRFSVDEGVNWTAADTFTDGAACTGMPLAPTVAEKSLTECNLILCSNGDLLIHSYERAGGGTTQWRSIDDGKTWTSEGQINSDTTLAAMDDWKSINDVLYVVARVDPGSDFVHPHYLALYTSADNGTTWVKKSDVEATLDCNEAGILHAGGNNIYVYVKDTSSLATYLYRSNDLGATWNSREDVTRKISILQKPKLKTFGSLHFIFGRQVEYTVTRTVVYVSRDGLNWNCRYVPITDIYADTGYCDMLQKSNGDYYMLSYGGTTLDADILEAIFQDVP